MQKGFIPPTISKQQATDTGMALVLVFLLIDSFSNLDCTGAAIICLLINMIYPKAFYLLAKLWLGLSNLLGTGMSKVALSIIFFIIVFPIGWFRKIAGADSLSLRQWKRNSTSAFQVREHCYEPEDFERPY